MGKRERTVEEVLREVRESALLQKTDIVLAGVSGGADSVFLLYLLSKMRDRGEIAGLYALHVHHGIRGEEADGDARFVRTLCRRLEVPCRVEYADVPALAAREKLSPEEAGRKARYELLFGELERIGGTRLAVAHHRDDCAETVLFNLVRGSGIRGLGGIAPERGKLVRPLLGLRRAEIERMLREAGLDWREDSTNADTGYSRNRIRRELIPWLEDRLNPDAVEHLAETAALLREIDAHMEAEAERWLREERPGKITVSRLLEADSALRGYAVRRRLAELGGLKDLTREHVEQVIRTASREAGKTVQLPGGRRVCRDYGELSFFLAEEEDGGLLPVKLTFGEISREIFEKKQFDQYTKCFDYDKIKQSGFRLRARREGDRLAVYADGRTQSVKEYMIGARIPARLRERIPLLVCGDEVLWIVGYRANEALRVTDGTERILTVTAEKETEDRKTGEERNGREN